jgi:hypothetical protein
MEGMVYIKRIKEHMEIAGVRLGKLERRVLELRRALSYARKEGET